MGRRIQQYTHLSILALTVGGFLGIAGAVPPETLIDDCASYSIDSDSFELVRYSFENDEFLVIGVVETESGNVVKDCESLSWVPHGMAKGLYSVPTKGPYERQVVKLDPLTAIATVFLPNVVPSNRKITGMTSYRNPDDEKWYLLAASSEDIASDPDRIETRILIRINPRDGTSNIAATQAKLGDGLRFESLGFDAKGDLYATSRTHFFRIHQEAGYWVEEIGATGLTKAEAFEVAFGQRQPSITVPGVDPSWTENGVFFVACEQTQLFGVLNPADGSFQEYLVNGSPSTFVMKDAEGLTLVTRSNDPLYGSIVGFD